MPPASHSPRPARERLDAVGAAISCACACHCVALPVVAALLPALGLGRLLGGRVEWAFVAATIVVGAASFGPLAWRTARAPGRWRVPTLFVAGLALLLGGRVVESRGDDQGADAGVVLGAGLVATAHLANRRRAVRATDAGDRASAAGCCPCPAEGPRS